MNHDLWFSLTTYVSKTTTVRSSFVDMMEADYKKLLGPVKNTHIWIDSLTKWNLVCAIFLYRCSISSDLSSKHWVTPRTASDATMSNQSPQANRHSDAVYLW